MTETEKKRARPCPICGQPPAARYRPFCSKRCADVDLGRWLTESYCVPADDPDESEESAWPAGEEGAPPTER